MSLFQMPGQRTTDLHQAFIHVFHAGLREVGGCHADTAPQVFVFYKVQEDAVQYLKKERRLAPNCRPLIHPEAALECWRNGREQHVLLIN